MSSAPTAERSTPTAISQELRNALVAAVRRRVPESEVEDIVQATLADALGSPHAPPESEAFRRWIFGIAKHKVVDYHRRAGRETFDMPDIAGQAAPHVEADLLRWAEKHLPPGEDNQTTLDWMLREGEGEKLESIAEAERVPAPRVRQRVSRLRRHLKEHWQKEAALLVAVGIIVTIVFVLRRKDAEEPIAKDLLPPAEELRRVGLEKCRAASWTQCIEKLDEAKALDPAGDTRPEIRDARDHAEKALTPAPSNTRPPPAPTSQVLPGPADSALPPMKQAPQKTATPGPSPTTTERVPTPRPPEPSKTMNPSGLSQTGPKTAPSKKAPSKPQGTKAGSGSMDDSWGSSAPTK